MQILIVEPFYAASHKQWADGLQQHSRHDISMLTLPPDSWKWRMRGAAVQLSTAFLNLKQLPDIIIATDMLDVATFKGMIAHKASDIPLLVYFHENQLNYPWSPHEKQKGRKDDVHFKWMNYTTALAAGYCMFNSHYHKTSFLNALPDFLNQFPDGKYLPSAAAIEKKSVVKYIGLDLSHFKNAASKQNKEVKTIVWNHRWEYDKQPHVFFNTLEELQQKKIPFKLLVLGEQQMVKAETITQTREKFSNELVHWGFVDGYTDYCRLLKEADILPVTSIQDFFGISVVEAAAAGCHLLLPDRLSYPELFDNTGALFYTHEEEFTTSLVDLLFAETAPNPEMKARAFQFDWKEIIDEYDDFFETVRKD